MMVGASDRMLSSSDIKFEPPQMKIFRITPKIVALVAGDPSAQMSICTNTERTLQIRQASGKAKDTVEEAAQLYADAFTAYRREIAVTRYLKPLGLDAHEFIERQSEFRGDFVTEIMSNLQGHSLEAETIIAGVDEDGPHIYIVSDPGIALCMDAIGFACIGSGKHHADAQFMLAHHTKQSPVHTALLQTYIAKKRAEGSPTVGNWTDLFFINAEGFQLLHHDLVREFHDVYMRFDNRNKENTATADIDARDTLVTFLNREPAAPDTEVLEPVRVSRKPRKKKVAASDSN